MPNTKNPLDATSSTPLWIPIGAGLVQKADARYPLTPSNTLVPITRQLKQSFPSSEVFDGKNVFSAIHEMWNKVIATVKIRIFVETDVTASTHVKTQLNSS